MYPVHKIHQYCLFIAGDYLFPDWAKYIYACSKEEALYKFRLKYHYQLLDFEDSDLLKMIDKVTE